MSHKIYQEFVKRAGVSAPVSENLVSPFQVDLPASVFSQAQQFISEIFSLSQHCSPTELGPDNLSLMTCFDFHYTEETGLKLIEINTNASLYPEFVILQEIHELNSFPNAMDLLWKDFQSSYQEIFSKQPSSIAIVDKEPKNEGLYFEMLLYEKWFRQLGLEAKVQSIAQWNENPNDFVYNRLTDFYLKEEESSLLKTQYAKGLTCVTPNPFWYDVLANKKRLEHYRKQLSSDLAPIIPVTKTFSQFESADEIWAQRKKFFFKPGQAFGGKGAYVGKGISRKAFEGIQSPDTIAQDYVPPEKRIFHHQGQDLEFKIDLRFFANRNQILNCGARLFRGQATNIKTPLGGLAPLVFR